jgi:aldehyde:ferredoxin oxidoreductase
MHGYHGQYARIDLGTGRLERVPLSEQELRRWIGGVGLGTWLLLRESDAGVDPLGDAAVVVFAFSPLVGTPLTTSAKFAVVAKSPLTDRLNDALSSSHFALDGKKTGFDALVLRGRCERPSVLLIDEQQARLVPADDLWGLPVQQATERLQQRLGEGWSFGVIGPAGEQAVRYATVSFAGRHAGRGGTGAVLGAKRLKALAVRGTQRSSVADPAGLIAAARDLSARSFGPATAKYRELGTVSNLLVFNRLNVLPTHNFQRGEFAEAQAISGEALTAAHRIARRSCAACTIGCEHIYAVRPDQPAGASVRMEYETLFALGPMCGIADRQAILQAAWLCDQLGLDTISTGATIAFAIECAERGLLTVTSPVAAEVAADLRRLPKLAFGDANLLLTLIERIARRDGLGALLAEGTRRVAGQLGEEAASFAPHVKGLELPGYEPRALHAMALGLAVGSRGADHNRSGAYEADFSAAADRRRGSRETARLAVETEDRAALFDSLILCKFLRGVFAEPFAECARLLELVCGWPITAEQLRQRVAEIVTLKKRYNRREGWTAAEDTLPARFLTVALPDGQAAGGVLTAEQLQEMVQAYYALRGWDQAGLPPE